MVRSLFAAISLLGLFLTAFTNVGTASVLAATGSCLVLVQQAPPAASEMKDFCLSLHRLNYPWSVPFYVGIIFLGIGVFGFLKAKATEG